MPNLPILREMIRLDQVTALHGISLTIPRGDMVSIVGRLGSGKSTLLNLIGGRGYRRARR